MLAAIEELHGVNHYDHNDEKYVIADADKPIRKFLFDLIARLQSVATIPMVDIGAYAKWLDK